MTTPLSANAAPREGLAHGDASAACVLGVESGEQVAELHGRVSPERFARLLAALGRYYGEAWLADS